jgi:nucleotide-binding universal stress UspA family protein
MGEEQLACPLSRGERILVAVDGSIYGEKALDQAISMATVCNSALFALTVIEAYPTALKPGPKFEERIQREASDFLKRVKDKAAKENVSCETIVHTGRQPHEFIVKEAKDRNIDLIVMGTHGRTGLRKLIMGSVVQKVIGYAPCAVMVIPAFPSE